MEMKIIKDLFFVYNSLQLNENENKTQDLIDKYQILRIISNDGRCWRGNFISSKIYNFNICTNQKLNLNLFFIL